MYNYATDLDDAGLLDRDRAAAEKSRVPSTVLSRTDTAETAVTASPANATGGRSARRTAGSDASIACVVADLAAVAVTTVLTASTLGGVLLFAGSMLLARAALRAYRRRLHLSALDEVPRTLASGVLCLGGVLAVRLVLLSGDGVAARSVLQVSCGVAAATVFTALSFAAVRIHRRRRPERLPTVLVVGWSKVGQAVDESLREHPELGLRPVGALEAGSGALDARGAIMSSGRVTPGDPETLTRAITASGADAVVLAFQGSADDHADAVITVHKAGCTVFVVPSVFELHHDGPDVERVRGIPLIRVRPDPTRRPSWWVKRLLDIMAALGGLFLAAPLLIAAATAIVAESGRPILFRQVRIGLDGRPFELLKLRSMRPASRLEGETTWNIAADPRLTRLGKVIRRTSIDEIPQLWNVVRGQMSMVGPRPERPVFVEQFSAEHERYWARHRVPAGLTGLAQVNGLRGDTSIRERARYDNYYIANWSLWLDAKIVLLTAREVLGGHGG